MPVVASGISVISVWSLIIAILRNPKLRSNTFDLYLVFCFAADAIYFTYELALNVVLLVYYNRYYESTEGYEGGWDLGVVYQLRYRGAFYWTCASLWMSFSIFVQIYKLLVSNKQAKRYQPPTRRQVIRDSTIIHAFSVVVAIAIALLEHFATDRIYDKYIAYLWAIYIPGVFLPTLLITGMCYKVWWNQMMPPKNNRYRSLTMFFARLLASIILMVIGVIIKDALDTWSYISGIYDGTAWSKVEIFTSFFGFFQVCLALTKKELRIAFVDLWCGCCRNSKKGSTSRTSTGISTNLTAHPTEDESHRIDDKDKSQGLDDSNDSELGNVVSHSCVDGDTSSVKNENGGSEEASEVVDTEELTENFISGSMMTNEIAVPEIHGSNTSTKV